MHNAKAKRECPQALMPPVQSAYKKVAASAAANAFTLEVEADEV
jgi:hypothetical protein